MYTGNIINDLENYLISNGLMLVNADYKLKWIERIGNKMEIAARRTREENENLTLEDYRWMKELYNLQEYYGYDVDIFGEYLEKTDSTNFKAGQFFTPLSLCTLLSEITWEDNEKYPVEIGDECSGTGRMMIAHSLVARRRSEKYHCMDYIYYNKDIDYKSMIISTLNASLRNLWSVNTWGDTLAVTTNKIYATIPLEVGIARWVDIQYERELAAKQKQRKLDLVG